MGTVVPTPECLCPIGSNPVSAGETPPAHPVFDNLCVLWEGGPRELIGLSKVPADGGRVKPHAVIPHSRSQKRGCGRAGRRQQQSNPRTPETAWLTSWWRLCLRRASVLVSAKSPAGLLLFWSTRQRRWALRGVENARPSRFTFAYAGQWSGAHR